MSVKGLRNVCTTVGVQDSGQSNRDLASLNNRRTEATAASGISFVPKPPTSSLASPVCSFHLLFFAFFASKCPSPSRCRHPGAIFVIH